jgi:hypothetical protein
MAAGRDGGLSWRRLRDNAKSDYRWVNAFHIQLTMWYNEEAFEARTTTLRQLTYIHPIHFSVKL